MKIWLEQIVFDPFSLVVIQGIAQKSLKKTLERVPSGFTDTAQ